MTPTEMMKFAKNNSTPLSVAEGNGGYEVVISNHKSASMNLEIDYPNEIYVIFNNWHSGLKGRWFGFKYFQKKFTEMQKALYEENFDYFANWQKHDED